ncbi:MAG: hypothetical protein KDJ29_17910 [Hyphomicrobiales bacterium]|nr:hypothetical protein [Hyphomicrobiales bacterium]
MFAQSGLTVFRRGFPIWNEILDRMLLKTIRKALSLNDMVGEAWVSGLQLFATIGSLPDCHFPEAGV